MLCLSIYDSKVNVVRPDSERMYFIDEKFANFSFTLVPFCRAFLYERILPGIEILENLHNIHLPRLSLFNLIQNVNGADPPASAHCFKKRLAPTTARN